MVIHDTFDRYGNPIELSPRNVLKKSATVRRLRAGSPVVAPEMEFYLTQRCADPDLPLQVPTGRSGVRKAVVSRSPSTRPTNSIRCSKTSTTGAKLQGLDLDTLIHEDGPAQMEINFRHGDALDLADQITVFKRTMREAALKHNVAATFMAKPITDEPGSAMHIHQSVVDIKTGSAFSACLKGSRASCSCSTSAACSVTSPKCCRCSRRTPTRSAASCRTPRRRSTWSGARKTAPWACACRVQPGRHAGGKPLAGRRRQPVPGHRREPAVRLHGHDRRHAIRARQCRAAAMNAATCACR
jgi:hypothetical protein